MFRTWQAAFKTRGFAPRCLLSLAALGTVMFFMAQVLSWVEDRPGVVLDDPVLAVFEPIDVSWLIFIAVYAALLATIYWAADQPWRWVMGIQAYTLFLIARGFFMWIAPFDPPLTMIPLEDPLVSSAAGGRTLTRDLFFSGHTATGVVLMFVTPKVWQRVVLGLLTLGIAVGVLLQHVHYTMDVAVAPFVAYACYRLALRMNPEARLLQS